MQNEQCLLTQSSYTSRERVLKALHPEETDRISIDFGSMASTGIDTGITGIMAITYTRPKKYLGVTKGQTCVFDMGRQLAEMEPEILTRFGVDVIALENSMEESACKSALWKEYFYD